MKRALRRRNNSKQIINNNPLKKQKLMVSETPALPPPQAPKNNGIFSDVLTVDTPRSDDTNTLHSDTSDSDTVTEYDEEVLDKEIAVKNINGKEQEKTKELNKNIVTEKTKLNEEEKEDPVKSDKMAISRQDKVIDEIVSDLDDKAVKSKDKGKGVEIVKKDESDLLQGILVETEDKSLSIFLGTEIKCHSLTVKSSVKIIKISPKSAISSISFKPKKVQIIMYHQGKLINQHKSTEFFNTPTIYYNPYSILLKNGLNYIEIWVKELKTSADNDEDSKFGQKHSLFITKL